MCRCQPLKGNRIVADFGNKDSSNKNEKPSLMRPSRSTTSEIVDQRGMMPGKV